MRLTKDKYYLEIAGKVLDRSTCLRRNYGAVIVKDDEIVGTGYNGAPRGDLNCCEENICERERLGCKPGERYELCRSVHAEMNAIISAGRERCIGATLYLAGKDKKTGAFLGSSDAIPCLLCLRVIKNAGIVRIVP